MKLLVGAAQALLQIDEHAAIDQQRRAGDVAAMSEARKATTVGHVVRLAETAERNALVEIVALRRSDRGRRG